MVTLMYQITINYLGKLPKNLHGSHFLETKKTCTDFAISQFMKNNSHTISNSIEIKPNIVTSLDLGGPA